MCVRVRGHEAAQSGRLPATARGAWGGQVACQELPSQGTEAPCTALAGGGPRLTHKNTPLTLNGSQLWGTGHLQRVNLARGCGAARWVGASTSQDRGVPGANWIALPRHLSINTGKNIHRHILMGTWTHRMPPHPMHTRIMHTQARPLMSGCSSCPWPLGLGGGG